MLIGNTNSCPAWLEQFWFGDPKRKRRATEQSYTTALNNDVAYFARGTRIATLKGDKLVETLVPGEKVITRGVGTLPIRWIGSSRMSVEGAIAPVLIKAGALSNHEDLVVSPDHRVLLHHPKAELLFGSNCALVPARYLINGETILPVRGGEIECWYLLFETHQIVYANGAMAESFYPSADALRFLDSENRSAVLSVLSDLRCQSKAGYGQTAARVLRQYEATALFEGPQGPSADQLRRLFSTASAVPVQDQSH